MDLWESADEIYNDVFYANFNQDCTSLAVGSNGGYKLYSLDKVDELKVFHENSVTGDIRIIERFFSSSLIALVTISAPRKLKVCHFIKGHEICNHSYSNTILAVKLNRTRLVVCLEESLHIHNIRDMKLNYIICDTPQNHLGLCILSSCTDNNFLAYPGSNSIGVVQIFDAHRLSLKNMIPAHENPLAAMAFDSTGTKIATASKKGTMIRVFSVLDNTKLYEFRRGMKSVRIYSLCFSPDSNFLSASSYTETVHIFRLDGLKQVKPTEEPQIWDSYLGTVIQNFASMVPYVTDMIYQGRSFATVRLPFSGLRNISALALIQNTLRILIVSAEGVLYIYNVDLVGGGDCVLQRTHNLLCSNEKRIKFVEKNVSDVAIPSPSTEMSNPSRPLPARSTSYVAYYKDSHVSLTHGNIEDH